MDKNVNHVHVIFQARQVLAEEKPRLQGALRPLRHLEELVAGGEGEQGEEAAAVETASCSGDSKTRGIVENTL